MLPFESPGVDFHDSKKPASYFLVSSPVAPNHSNITI